MPNPMASAQYGRERSDGAALLLVGCEVGNCKNFSVSWLRLKSPMTFSLSSLAPLFYGNTDALEVPYLKNSVGLFFLGYVCV